MVRSDRQMILDRVPSPLGAMLLVSRDHALVGLDFADCADRLMAGLRRRYPQQRPREAAGPAAVRSALQRYFEGDLRSLDGIAVELAGTPFQQRVWQALRAIPPGTTVTYTELARRAGAPRAIRAAGHANGSNPVSLVVPCHRVIGRNGSLTGYAGGIPRKHWLLVHEGAIAS